MGLAPARPLRSQDAVQKEEVLEREALSDDTKRKLLRKRGPDKVNDVSRVKMIGIRYAVTEANPFQAWGIGLPSRPDRATERQPGGMASCLVVKP